MYTDNHEKVEQIEDLSDLEEAERIEINILSLSAGACKLEYMTACSITYARWRCWARWK